MTTAINELRQHALMEANKFKATLSPESTDKIKKAYQLAKEFNELICPRCWVNDGRRSKLGVVAWTQESNVYIYACGKCEFEQALPKEKPP